MYRDETCSESASKSSCNIGGFSLDLQQNQFQIWGGKIPHVLFCPNEEGLLHKLSERSFSLWYASTDAAEATPSRGRQWLRDFADETVTSLENLSGHWRPHERQPCCGIILVSRGSNKLTVPVCTQGFGKGVGFLGCRGSSLSAWGCPKAPLPHKNTKLKLMEHGRRGPWYRF